MLNPSTADETQDDPTIRRCIGYAKAWGYGGLIVGNAFALRSTDPRALYSHVDPVGPDNDRHLRDIAHECPVIVCGWGTHGRLKDRHIEVAAAIRSVGAVTLALRVTKEGQPGHPLYLSKDLRPEPWSVLAA